MARAVSTAVPKWKVDKIMEYFRTHKDNRSCVIAEKFKIKTGTIDKIIHRKLSEKQIKN